MSNEIFLENWVSLQTSTATDQFIAINKSNGEAWSFRTDNPKSEGWYHWLIVPRPDGKRYWLFNRLAQGGSGECLTLPEGKTNFGQWKFTGEPRQTFELRRASDKKEVTLKKNYKVTLICEENHEALATRWNHAAFTWKYDPNDDQQKLLIDKVESLKLPKLPKIEGEPGALDRELLRVDSFEAGIPEETTPRVVGYDLIAFTGVHDGRPIGDQMNYSPYYLLVRQNYWTRSFDEEYSGAGDNEKTFEWEVGIKTTSATSIEHVLDITVGVEASYNKSGPGGAGGITVTAHDGHTWKESSSVERYEGQKGKSVRRFKEGKHVRVACWHLVNLYTLKHCNGEIVGQIASIEPAVVVERAYPASDAPNEVSNSFTTKIGVAE